MEIGKSEKRQNLKHKIGDNDIKKVQDKRQKIEMETGPQEYELRPCNSQPGTYTTILTQPRYRGKG